MLIPVDACLFGKFTDGCVAAEVVEVAVLFYLDVGAENFSSVLCPVSA